MHQIAVVAELATEQAAQLAVPLRVGFDADARRERSALCSAIALSEVHLHGRALTLVCLAQQAHHYSKFSALKSRNQNSVCVCKFWKTNLQLYVNDEIIQARQRARHKRVQRAGRVHSTREEETV